MREPRRRVVVTGMGVITPLGHSVGELFASQLEGRTAVGPITRFDARTFPTTFASEVKGFDLGRYLKDPTPYQHCGVNTQFAVAATKQALEDAGLLDPAKGDRSRVGVYLGSGEGCEDFPSLITSIARAADAGAAKVDSGRFCRTIMGLLEPAREAELEMYTTSGH